MEEYEPVDTDKIKISKIRTEKDLEKEVIEISKVLKDTSTVDWKERVKSMENLQGIVLSDGCVEMETFPKLIEKLVRPLVAQLMDLRSAVTKEASLTVRIMAQSLQNDFNSVAAKLMDSNGLFKLVSSATKMMSEHGNL